jgi:hypothetical protein
MRKRRPPFTEQAEETVKVLKLNDHTVERKCENPLISDAIDANEEFDGSENPHPKLAFHSQDSKFLQRPEKPLVFDLTKWLTILRLTTVSNRIAH